MKEKPTYLFEYKRPTIIIDDEENPESPTMPMIQLMNGMRPKDRQKERANSRLTSGKNSFDFEDLEVSLKEEDETIGEVTQTSGIK